MTGSGKWPISGAIAKRRATPSFDGSPVPDDVLSVAIAFKDHLGGGGDHGGCIVDVGRPHSPEYSWERHRPTTTPGYYHPGQYMTMQDVKPADNMYPVIQHPEQDKAAQDKVTALQQKTGKKPNILIFLLDDVGWMDPGFNGGGS